MPRKGLITGRCKICRHSERVRLERLLAGGASYRSVAKKFGLSYDATRRHWIGHVSDELRAAYIAGANRTKQDLEAMAADESLGLLDHYRIIRGRLYRAFDSASIADDGHGVATLAGRLHENLAGAARLTGELHRGGIIVNNNFTVDPGYMRAIGAIVAAVAPFPEARREVIAALRRIEGGEPAMANAALPEAANA